MWAIWFISQAYWKSFWRIFSVGIRRSTWKILLAAVRVKYRGKWETSGRLVQVRWWRLNWGVESIRVESIRLGVEAIRLGYGAETRENVKDSQASWMSSWDSSIQADVWTFFPPHHQTIFRHQLDVLRFDSTLTLSTWKEHLIKGSVPQVCPTSLSDSDANCKSRWSNHLCFWQAYSGL
mgnify:FL=1